MNELDFEAWLAHPATQALMSKAKASAELARQRWVSSSWMTPITELDKLDTVQLAYLRGKAEIFDSFARIEYKNLFKKEQ
jgi:hypothetical protein